MKKFKLFTNLAMQVLIIAAPISALAQTESNTGGEAKSEVDKKNMLAPKQNVKLPPTKVEGVKKEEPVVIDFTKNDKSKVQKSEKVSPSVKSSNPRVDSQLEKQLQDLANQQSNILEKKRNAPANVKNSMNLAPANTQTTAKKSTPLKLFGRIEQISAKGSVKMPVLKALTPKMDTSRTQKLKAKTEQNTYSGTIAKFFPSDFVGQWGGQLQIWSYHWSPLYLKVDRAEAVQSAKILKKGRTGNVNFHFYKNRRGTTSLKPADVLVSIPLKDSHNFSQMMKNSPKSQMAPFGNSFDGVMGNMNVPIVKISFGNVQTDGVMLSGVSGNQFKQTLVRNVIRQLSPNVIEQQIITKSVSKIKGTGKTKTGYAESVLRFKKLGRGKLYVLAASVNYTSKGKYLDKLIMYGNVQQGRLVQTDPMSGINKMMGNMMNMQGLGSMFGMPTNTNQRGKSGGHYNKRANPYGGGLPGGFNPMQMMKQLQQQQQKQNNVRQY